jgi:4'-phosphopantetheinyl transferase
MHSARQYLGRHVVARLVRTAVEEGSSARLENSLCDQDRERAARYRFPEDRMRFVLGRALLGKLLRHYLDYPAQAIEFSFTAQGRPVLAQDAAVQFSISHSRDLVAVALSSETLVGVDVQHIPHDFKSHALAERIFSDDDLKIFRALPASEAARAFFRAWTGKEAVLKAQGVGLSGGLKEVPVIFHGAAAADAIGADETMLPGWRLQPLPVPADYLGHAAWNDPRKALDFREMKLSDEP